MSSWYATRAHHPEAPIGRNRSEGVSVGSDHSQPIADSVSDCALGEVGAAATHLRWILRGVTTPTETDVAEDLLLVAIVEMAPGHLTAGQGYEDAVLALLDWHGGRIERRLRTEDSAAEVHVIGFRSRRGYESFMVDPDRLALREQLGDGVPTTRVIEVHDVYSFVDVQSRLSRANTCSSSLG